MKYLVKIFKTLNWSMWPTSLFEWMFINARPLNLDSAIVLLSHVLSLCMDENMGGDLWGQRGRSSQNLRWRDGPCIRPPIFWEVVLSSRNFFWNRGFSREERAIDVSYITFHTSLKTGKIRKIWSMTKFRNLGLRNIFRPPKLGARSPPMAENEHSHKQEPKW